jgi:hypothetical protein
MSVLRPGFSERVFEFSFNAEYADRNRAILAGAPSIPTQNQEKSLGYDVMFEVNGHGGAIHAVALQHKVSRFVDRLGPTNTDFWRAAGGPYFAFRLDTDQYNLIQFMAAARVPSVEFQFCAPLFATRAEMNSHYMTGSVEGNSMWIDVAGAGPITDGDAHTIIYRQDGTQAFRFSQSPKMLTIAGDAARRVQWEGRRMSTLEAPELIYSTALKRLREYWPDRRAKTRKRSDEMSGGLPSKLPNEVEPTLANAGRLLADYFGMSLLLEVRY